MNHILRVDHPHVDRRRRKVAAIAALVAVLALVGAWFAPSVVEGISGGFALSALMILIAVVAGATAWVYRRMAREAETMLREENLLAHWIVGPEEWQRFVRFDRRESAREKKILLYIVSGWAIFFAVLFPILDPEHGWYVTAAMAVLIAIIGATVYLSVRWSGPRGEGPGEIHLSRNGLSINGRLFCWKIAGGRLETAVYYDEPPSRVEIQFSTIARGGRITHTVRAPVPADRADEARRAVATLMTNKGASHESR